MSGFSFKSKKSDKPDQGFRSPTTDTQSRTLMLAAERGDNIQIDAVVELFNKDAKVPDHLSVKQRTSTYYGPKFLVVDSQGREYLLTAPGPDRELLLYFSETNERGVRESWRRLAEVQAFLEADQEQYDLCPHCAEPMKTIDHDRMATVGRCPNL